MGCEASKIFQQQAKSIAQLEDHRICFGQWHNSNSVSLRAFSGRRSAPGVRAIGITKAPKFRGNCRTPLGVVYTELVECVHSNTGKLFM